jgi:hypothetical protein
MKHTGERGVVRLKTNRDGSRATSISKGRNRVYAIDMLSGDSLSEHAGLGCQGCISPSGNRIVRGTTTNVPDSLGLTDAGYKAFCTELFDTRDGLKWYYAPGQPNGGANRVREHYFSINSDDHMVCHGHTDPLKYYGYVYDLRTGEYRLMGGTESPELRMRPYDFWLGELPDPSDAPTVATHRARAAHRAARVNGGAASLYDLQGRQVAGSPTGGVYLRAPQTGREAAILASPRHAD